AWVRSEPWIRTPYSRRPETKRQPIRWSRVWHWAGASVRGVWFRARLCASVTNSPDSIVALTDSVTHKLLRQVWQRGEAPTPSLEAALETRSVPALRAFLEGE